MHLAQNFFLFFFVAHFVGYLLQVPQFHLRHFPLLNILYNPTFFSSKPVRPNGQTCKNVQQCYSLDLLCHTLAIDTAMKSAQICAYQFPTKNNSIFYVVVGPDMRRRFPLTSCIQRSAMNVCKL